MNKPTHVVHAKQFFMYFLGPWGLHAPDAPESPARQLGKAGDFAHFLELSSQKGRNTFPGRRWALWTAHAQSLHYAAL